MNTILAGIIKSEHPVAIKNGVAFHIASSIQASTDSSTVIPLLKTCCQLHFGVDCTLEKQQVIEIVLNKCIECQKKTVENFLMTEYLQVPNKIADDLNVISFQELRYFLLAYKKCHKVFESQLLNQLKDYLLKSFPHVKTFDVLSAVCDLYLDLSYLVIGIIDKDFNFNIIKKIFDVVSNTPYVFPTANQNSMDKGLESIYKLFALLVNRNLQLMKLASGYLFKLLSNQKTHPSISMAKFLPCLELEKLVTDIEDIMRSNVANGSLLSTLGHIIDWICFPDQNLKADKWVLHFMRSLIKYQKFEVLFQTIDSKSKQVCNMIFFPKMRAAAVQVLTFMLMSYLHSPDPFHQVAPIFPNLLDYLNAKETEETKKVCIVLVELIYTLMYHFPGYPDIYGPLLLKIKGFKKPSENDMKGWLEASLKLPHIQINHVSSRKSDTGKIGLENLGNTCYMNSVIQALFNLHNIRLQVLSKTYAPMSQPISSSFQNLIALLSKSEVCYAEYIWRFTGKMCYLKTLTSKFRPAIAAREFCKLSRPPWFTEGSQQDCSEYLKYLLDVIQQEGQSKDEIVNRLCTGEINTTIECLQCHNISCRTECFNDIPLSFHSMLSNEPSSSGTCTLKGGDSSERLGRKRHLHGLTSELDDMAMDTTEEVEEQSSAVVAENISTNDEVHHYSVVGMLNSYFSPEDLRDTNMYHCETCATLQNARKFMQVTNYPQYLILTLKRFTYNVQTQKRSKILQTIEYQSQINVCQGCVACQQEHNFEHKNEDEKPDNSNQTSQTFTSMSDCTSPEKYRLASIIVHSGMSSDNGHYYCYACSYLEDGSPSWVLLNDSRVNKTPDDFLQALGKTFPRDTPYVLVYEKICEMEEKVVELSDHLKQMIARDNEKYFQELQDETSRRKNAFVFPRDKPNDDDDGGGMGPCGGGQGGSNSFEGSKFVF